VLEPIERVDQNDIGGSKHSGPSSISLGSSWSGSSSSFSASKSPSRSPVGSVGSGNRTQRPSIPLQVNMDADPLLLEDCVVILGSESSVGKAALELAKMAG
jgi:hypothetical protein